MSPAPNWSVLLVRNQHGPLPTLSNIVQVLQHDPHYAVDKLYYDEFLDRIFFVTSHAREWVDEDDTRATVYMQDTTGMVRLSDQLVAKGVRLVAKQRVRHVVKEWLSPIVWDQVPRIAHAFEDYWGATTQPSEYVRAASSNFFVGLIARLMRPGCKHDTMPVFEGQQGIKKSSALDVLGGPWYGVVNESVASKDFYQCLRGKWLLEISELQAFSRSDVAHVKSMMSTRSDNYRPSYGRCNVEFPRQCVFAGTTNVDDWATDETGMRRFWPIVCGAIDLDLLAAARDQLFAEALDRYRHGATWWEMPADTVTEQAARQQGDAWRELVMAWAHLQVLQGATYVTMPELALAALKLPSAQLDKSAQMRIARILRLEGWLHTSIRNGSDVFKAWTPPVVTGGNSDFVP